MKLPSLEQAEGMLLEAEQLNPGPWVPHVRNVAIAAKCIAERHQGLNAENAYIMGLLHDIGRREGVSGMRHTIDGYIYLQDQSYDDAARICLTHSFPYKNPNASFGTWDCTKEEFEIVKNYLRTNEYDDYDRLIQLCDCLALPEGICLLEKRMIDVVMRYGFNEYTLAKWQAFIDIKEGFEKQIGKSIYSFLPSVIETTFGFKD